jgi:hypothetical protein
LWTSGASGALRARGAFGACDARRASRTGGALSALWALKASWPLRANKEVCDPITVKVCRLISRVIDRAQGGELDPIKPTILIAVIKE